MSRTILPLLSLTLIVACQAPTPRSAVVRGRVPPPIEAVEAGLVGLDRANAPAITEPEVLAVDPVVVKLLKSAFRSYAERRRVVLENIANVHTPGYKKRVVLTRTKMVRGAGDHAVPVPVQLNASSIFTTGVLEITDRSLDVAIDGDGFFSVLLVDGSTGYVRAGNFFINANGKFVTADGFIVTPEISVPSDTLEISIDPTGLCSGRTAGAPDTATVFGNFTIHRFINPPGLLPGEGTVWRATDSSGAPFTAQPGLHGCGLLKQGFLERSNVQLELELINLQALERQHQILTKVLAQFGMIAP